MKRSACVLLLSLLSFFAVSCAHRPVDDDTSDSVAEAPAPAKVKTKIKYVYVESPSTTSAMTTEPFERTETPPKSFSSEVFHILWPLIAMIATGLVFILVLLGEHLILNRQLARRAQLKAQLCEAASTTGMRV